VRQERVPLRTRGKGRLFELGGVPLDSSQKRSTLVLFEPLRSRPGAKRNLRMRRSKAISGTARSHG